MTFRIFLAWILAIPMLSLLALFFLMFCAAVFLLSVYGPDPTHVFFVTGSFVYLFCAHVLYFGSYFAHPALYQNRLRFVRSFLHTRISLIFCAITYVVALVHILHYFRMI
jgi:hypothetical protein